MRLAPALSGVLRCWVVREVRKMRESESEKAGVRPGRTGWLSLLLHCEMNNELWMINSRTG